MIQFDDFEEFDPKAGPHCIACEAMLTDAVDGTLGEIDRAWFDRHIGGCVRCAEKLADAQRGSAWLEMLKTPRPEPGPELMARILAQTTGAEGGTAETPMDSTAAFSPAGTAPFPAYMPFVAQPQPILLAFQPPVRARATGMRAFGRILFEPRLAMTAAMAFFSIALTMNLTGVRLDQLHASDLKPETLRRGYYQATSRAVQYYDNLRVVHVVESRVEDLRQAAEDTQQRQTPEVPREPGTDPAPQAPPASRPNSSGKPDGTSRRETPAGARPRVLVAEDRGWMRKMGGRA